VAFLRQWARIGLFPVIMCGFWLAPLAVAAAPYAAMVIDARSGEVLHSRNADTRLHPASLTKMMTLYIAFEAVEHGEISLDTVVTVSRNAAAEPPSKLGLRAGQKIKLRYLIRAAAIKSANDAATAIGEAISGSESAFAARMNRTAQALGMNSTTFKNAHGLTAPGHLSTARDMTTLGRHLFYDYPEYYNLFSRITTNAGGTQVANTNRRFLSAYRGADGIKTGYTRAAGFNLVASAERGNERIIATVFGGTSTANRNAKVAELLDLGFQRAPTQVAVRKPARPPYMGNAGATEKTVRVAGAVARSLRPLPRPVRTAPSDEILLAMQDEVERTLADVTVADAAEPLDDSATIDTAALDETVLAETALAAAVPAVTPPEKPEEVIAELAGIDEAVAEAVDDALSEDDDEGEVTDIALMRAEADEMIGDEDMGEVDVARLVTASAIPLPRPTALTLSAPTTADEGPEVVTRMSTSGGRHWGINVGRYPSRHQAEKMLLQTALVELSTLEQALRKVVQAHGGFEANFVGMTEEQAALACRRLSARNVACETLGPS
jgi:D-alanyl-D-alanine carboxypeptidase